MSVTRRGGADLCASRARITAGEVTASALLEASLAAADGPLARHAFIRRFDAQARAVAAGVDAAHAAGAPLPPLAGLSVSIKDLFDIAGTPTTGGSTVLASSSPAGADCPAVSRLRAGGAAFVGHTNLSEFAFSGVGLNPHHGTPANAATAIIDPTPRVPGGSTSGGAVSVACGAAWAALGSDTGGSIRIPAALQGLVGFKSTQRLTPLAGSIPLSTTLDTVCAITLSVRDAVLAHELLSARSAHLEGRPLERMRFAVPTTLLLDSLEPAVAGAFERSLAALRDGGAVVQDIELPELAELASLNSQGGFSAAESWAWHRAMLARDGDRYDPRVAVRIQRGQHISAADYIDLVHARHDWIRRVETRLRGFDAALSPTVPMVAPEMAPLLGDDQAFFDVNGKLLRNTSPMNFLDGCALSLPCHESGALPVGLMVWAPAMHDDLVLEASLLIEDHLARTGG